MAFPAGRCFSFAVVAGVATPLCGGGRHATRGAWTMPNADLAGTRSTSRTAIDAD